MDDLPDIEIGIESHLTEEVSVLWSEHTRVAGQKKASIAELRVLRTRLAAKLFEAKQLLSRRGRGGQWRGWLAQIGIARSTADRLAEWHGEKLGGSAENVLTGSISAAEEVEKLIQNMLPRLRRTLVTREMAYRFVMLLAEGLGFICAITDASVPFTESDSEEEPSVEPEPRLQQDESTPEPEPCLPQDEPINRVSHTRYAGVRIAQPWDGYKQRI